MHCHGYKALHQLDDEEAACGQHSDHKAALQAAWFRLLPVYLEIMFVCRMHIHSAHAQAMQVCSAHGRVLWASQLTLPLCRRMLNKLSSIAVCDAILKVAAPAHLHPFQDHFKCCRAADGLWTLGHKGSQVWRTSGRLLQRLLA